MTSIGSSLVGRVTKRALDRLLDWRWTRDPVATLGRYVFDRSNGDNDPDMATNGEGALLERLPALLADRPPVLFDVGANLGEWTAMAHRRFGSDATIYAFEPVASLFAQLEQRIRALAPAPRVVLTHAALSDVDGAGEMRVYGGGASSLHDRDLLTGGAAVAREPVRRIRGDTFCREQSIERIGFVKIDVEGHELAVLHGFTGMLAAGRIDAIQFEYGGAWIDSRCWLRDAFDLLTGHGYAVGKLVASGVRWIPNYHWRLESFRYANYVAVLADRRRLLA